MKSKCCDFSGYKQRNKMCSVVSTVETATEKVWWTHFQDNAPENSRKKIFRVYQTKNKIPLMFLDVKVLTER